MALNYGEVIAAAARPDPTAHSQPIEVYLQGVQAYGVTRLSSARASAQAYFGGEHRSCPLQALVASS